MQDIRKNRMRPLIILTLLFISLGLCGYAAYSAFWKSSPAPNLQTPKKKAEKPAGKQTGSMQGKTEAKPQHAVPETLLEDHHSPETLGDLARIRGRRFLLEEEVKVGEYEKRLKDLNQESSPAPIQEIKPIVLPELTPPKMAGTETGRKAGTVVVSVQGVGEKLSATLRKADGSVVTLRHGSSFAGGTLIVTRKGVSIRNNGKLNSLPFE